MAIMMVEAGGTEKSFAYYAEGAKKVDEAVLASGLDASKTWIKESIPAAAPAPRQCHRHTRSDRAAPVHPGRRLRRRRRARRRRARHRRPGQGRDDLAQAGSQRAIDAAGDAAIVELCGTSEAPGEFAGREREIKDAVLKLTKKLVRKRIVEEGVRIDGVVSPTCDRCRPKSACCRPPTARSVPARRDAGAEHPHARHAAHEPAPRHADAGDAEALSAPLQHAAGPTARLVAPGRRSAARSVMGRSPPAVLPVVPSQEEFAYTLRLVSEVFSPPTARRRWRRCAHRACR